MTTLHNVPPFLLPRLSWRSFPTLSTSQPRNLRFTSSFSNFSTSHSTQRKQRQRSPAIASTALRRPVLTIQIRTPCPQNLYSAFSTSAPTSRDHHFDTLKFVQRLRGEGFTEEQSKALMLVLSDVIEESIQNLTRTMILKEGTHSASQLSMIFVDRGRVYRRRPLQLHAES